MKDEIINIATLSKGRLKNEAENVFEKCGLRISKKSERSLIGSIKKYSCSAPQVTDVCLTSFSPQRFMNLVAAASILEMDLSNGVLISRASPK